MKTLYFVLVLCTLACGNSQHSKALNTMGSGDSTRSIKVSYQLLNDSVQGLRRSYHEKLKQGISQNQVLQEASGTFVNLIAESYYPIWAGTQWDFYGTTQTPQIGQIACGYFVTTVLRDMGVKIDRVAMAETYSEKMIKTLVQPQFIKKFVPFDLKKFEAELKKSEDAVYLAGLDNHTGFVLVKNHEVFFIHSSVISPGCVVKEPALESMALFINHYMVVGKLSADPKLMLSWINP